ncbi:MAG: hypothetical protein LBD99_00390 [Candidatus Margulisbacteria bacterium]|jgi:ssDNA-binding Zn-finger/Zn-ribbon topoisomerase 1|nr:hypothetical protein [Candidatus Margulisiibacteriota bacterium]
MTKKTKKKSIKKNIIKQTPKVCPECGQAHPLRENLNVKAAREEVVSLIMINNRVNVAAQAASPVNVAPNVTREQIKLFVEAALEAKAEAMSLQRQWWREIFAKYPELPKDKNVFVDFDTGEFYLLVQA